MVQRVVGGEEAHPRPERNGEAAAEYGRAPRRRAVPELSPNHGELVQRGGINRVPEVEFFSGVPLRSETMVVLDKPSSR